MIRVLPFVLPFLHVEDCLQVGETCEALKGAVQDCDALQDALAARVLRSVMLETWDRLAPFAPHPVLRDRQHFFTALYWASCPVVGRARDAFENQNDHEVVTSVKHGEVRPEMFELFEVMLTSLSSRYRKARTCWWAPRLLQGVVRAMTPSLCDRCLLRPGEDACRECERFDCDWAAGAVLCLECAAPLGERHFECVYHNRECMEYHHASQLGCECECHEDAQILHEDSLNFNLE